MKIDRQYIDSLLGEKTVAVTDTEDTIIKITGTLIGYELKDQASYGTLGELYFKEHTHTFYIETTSTVYLANGLGTAIFSE